MTCFAQGEHPSFKAVQEMTGRKHKIVNHGKDEYVRGDAYKNTVEGFFSLLKRGVNGVYHHVSRGHLARYCDEFSFRYENRKISDGERAAKLVLSAEGKRLTYRSQRELARAARQSHKDAWGRSRWNCPDGRRSTGARVWRVLGVVSGAR